MNALPGHEGHQAVIALPQRTDGKIWVGTVSWSSSKPVKSDCWNIELIIAAMSGKSVSSMSSSSASLPSKVIPIKDSEPVTINEKVTLTKEQNEVLRMICNSYEMIISEYMQQALVEAMRFDIEEGNFSDVLLDGNIINNGNSVSLADRMKIAIK